MKIYSEKFSRTQVHKGYMSIYLGFYIAFNTVQIISRRVVGRAEETSTYSSLGLCTVNCRPTASNYQLSHLRPSWGSNPGLRGGRRECYMSKTPLYSVKCSVGHLMTIFNKSLIVNHCKKFAVGQHMKIYSEKFSTTQVHKGYMSKTPQYSVKCSVGRLMIIFNKSLIVNHCKKFAVGQHMKIYSEKFSTTQVHKGFMSKPPQYSVKCSVGRLMTIFNKSLIVNHFKQFAMQQQMETY